MHSWTSPASTSADLVRPIEWLDGTVRFIDQRALPARTEFVTTIDPMVVVEAIGTLAIRGAPLIGIAAAYAIALAARQPGSQNSEERLARLERFINIVVNSRPTAVNLSSSCERMRSRAIDGRSKHGVDWGLGLLAEAQQIHAEDAAACESIARHGVEFIPKDGTVMTLCNTGRLATGGRGTAFGIISLAWEQGQLHKLFISETRPLFQGSRLTAWEAQRLGIPSTIHTDSMAGMIFREHAVDAVIVGADRIASNGDTANKVGTYALAVLAKAHGVPFIVAAPTTTIDRSITSGKHIPIEDRPPVESAVVGGMTVAPEGMPIMTPAFDVTPAEFIAAIVTEEGVHRPPYESDFSSARGTGRPT